MDHEDHARSQRNDDDPQDSDVRRAPMPPDLRPASQPMEEP
jgi:hypothetical protein